jgi:hypothetical protein
MHNTQAASTTTSSSTEKRGRINKESKTGRGQRRKAKPGILVARVCAYLVFILYALIHSLVNSLVRSTLLLAGVHFLISPDRPGGGGKRDKGISARVCAHPIVSSHVRRTRGPRRREEQQPHPGSPFPLLFPSPPSPLGPAPVYGHKSQIAQF